MSEGATSHDREFASALRSLGSAQKSPVGVPAYTRYVNRPLGRIAAAAAYVMRLTPNQVTLISAVISFVAIYALAAFEPSWALGFAITAGLGFGYVLDSADGQLARLRGGGSPAGEWLDHVVDAARLPALHLAVLIALFRFDDGVSLGILLIPTGYLLVSVVRFFSLMLAEQMKKALPSGASTQTFAGDSLLKSLALLPLDFGALCIVFVLWGSTSVFLAVYSVLFVANTILLAVTLARRYRELARAA